MTKNNSKLKKSNNKVDLKQLAMLTTEILIKKVFEDEPKLAKTILKEANSEHHKATYSNDKKSKSLNYIVSLKLKNLFDTKIYPLIDFEEVAKDIFK
ncbi:MAG: hypothetical protein GY730_06705 [bacterium]|nr:hypothetical protein [bacterium]